MNLDDEHALRLTERFTRQALAFDDQQRELSGVGAGRIARFLPGETHGGSHSAAKKREADAATRLDILLATNAAYAQAYHQTAQRLGDAQSKLDDALILTEARIRASDDALIAIRTDAAKLDDGTSVYRDMQGDIRFENGRSVDPVDAETIIWRGGEPTFEELQSEIERNAALRGIENDIIAGQAEIGDMQDALSDEANPVGIDDLEAFKDRAGEITTDIDERLDRIAASSAPEADKTAVGPVAGVVVPQL